MNQAEIISPHPIQKVIPQQAESDEHLIQLWLHGRSPHTIKGYLHDINLFRQKCNTDLCNITLQQLHDYADFLAEQQYSPATIKRLLCAVKSLFTFGYKIGYLDFDTGKPLRIPNPKEKLSERILSEDDVKMMINAAKMPRNKLLIEMLYYTGLRVSEVAKLKWSDFQPRDKTGQITIQTKGSKTNVLLLPKYLWDDLMSHKNNVADNTSVFMSRKGNRLSVGQIQRIVKKVAQQAGIHMAVSPHWMRHSHASHAIENGCPLHIIQKQLNHSSIATTGKYLHARPSESSSKYLK